MLATLCLLVMPQIETATIAQPLSGVEPVELFTVYRQSGSSELLVSANKSFVSAERALHQLARQMSWKYLSGPDVSGERLGQVSLDLAFTKQPPKIVAHLIAAAAGLDVAFNEAESRTELHVISSPTAESESGRARLRKWAIHWYSQFLTKDPAVAHSPLVEEHGLEILMHLGKLLLQANELEEAVKVYNRIFEEDDSQVYVPMSLLRLTQAHYELALVNDIPEAKRHAHLQMAEEAARKLTRMNPRLKPTAQAMVLLGKIMMRDGRYSECIKNLESGSLRLANTPEIIDIYLLVAECHTHGELPAQVLQALDTLERHRSYKQWSRRQWLDYHYLRGLGAESLGHSLQDRKQRAARFEESMQAMEWFLGIGKSDRRRGQAFVVLGRVYLELGKFLEARAASVEAMLEKNHLDLQWLQAARILEAKSALALGEMDSALTNLEVVVRPSPEKMPELVLFLVQTLSDVGRYDRAISNADLLVKEPGAWGDQARMLRIQAMFKQARTSGSMAAFPPEAIKYALRIEDKAHQQTASEIIGRAYESLNMIERASEAYRGILR